MHSAASVGTSGRCFSLQQQGQCGAMPRQWRVERSRNKLIAPLYASHTNSFAEQAKQFAESAQQRMQSFVQEQKLDEKASAAADDAKKKLAAAYEEGEQAVRRTYMKLESEHNISDKVTRTRRWFSETAWELDQEYSIRRRIRSAADDVQRMLPTWRRQLTEFSNTQFGKASLTLLLVGLLLSGVLWQLLNVVWLLWWISIPVSLFLASQRSKAAGAAAGSGSSPFGGSSSSSSPFGSGGAGPFGANSSWGGYGSSSNNYGSSSSSNGGRGFSSEGPVVDAEWTSLDDDDDNSGRKRRR